MDRKPTKVDLKELREDAPLTTRMNVPFYEGDIPDKDAGAMYLMAGKFGLTDCILIRPFYPEGATLTRDFDEDDYPVEYVDYSVPKEVLAHELTHAYLEGYQKEFRGRLSLFEKMSTDPGLKTKLTGVSDDLIKSDPGKITSEYATLVSELLVINEAAAYAVGQLYGGVIPDMPPNLEDLSLNPENFKSSVRACQRLIKFVGIDGARAFVRRKMREMYLSGAEGKTLEEEVDDFEKSVAGFFVSSDVQA